MAYNIDSIRQKEIVDFKVSIDLIKEKFAEFSNHPNSLRISEIGGTVRFYGGPGLEGEITDGYINVSEFDVTGEWSGSIWQKVLLPAFAEATGIAELVLIWEGGDTIERVRIENGEITETEIDL